MIFRTNQTTENIFKDQSLKVFSIRKHFTSKQIQPKDNAICITKRAFSIIYFSSSNMYFLKEIQSGTVPVEGNHHSPFEN